MTNDPTYQRHNPHQVFLLVFSLLTSLPLLWLGESGAPAMDAALNDQTVRIWGGCLLFGSLLALVGEWWPGQSWTSLVMERTGLSLVGIGAVFYAAVLVVTVDPSVSGGPRFIAGVTMAYSLSCFWRVVQITRRLRWIKALVVEFNGHTP